MSHSQFDHRHYVGISSGDASLVNFDEVMETSINTLRYSVDGTQTFVKYEGDQPASVASCPSKSVEYSWQEMINLLTGIEWSPTGDLI